MGEGDAQLATRAAKGDMAALEVLYRRHVDRVWRYAWFRTGSRDLAADVIQETFLRITRSIGQFKGRSSFAAWLLAVSRSVVIERARRERRVRTNADDATMLRLIPATCDRPDSVSDQEVRDATRRAVAELPGPQRDAIVLCELSELSVREAAEMLGWGESRVKVTLFRARRRLRDRLRDYVSDEAGETHREQKT